MPSAAFQKAADESRQLKAKPSNDELLEVSQGAFPFQFTARLRRGGYEAILAGWDVRGTVAEGDLYGGIVVGRDKG
ncbi:hypothetical protein CLCR_09372 [Cladophialophora carrionii]|uniref:Uncharacterized protein n=1 Tax=Cladophialophora carrionii TaxID=86049 RepID=A0A1C1CQU4_9EURO|nr:hypothetical protein CLCR_09372 [Cladophialophora carrionii]